MITVQQPAGLRSFLLQIDGMREEGVTAERTPEKPMRLRGEMVCVREHLISFDHHPRLNVPHPLIIRLCAVPSQFYTMLKDVQESDQTSGMGRTHLVNEVQLTDLTGAGQLGCALRRLIYCTTVQFGTEKTCCGSVLRNRGREQED